MALTRLVFNAFRIWGRFVVSDTIALRSCRKTGDLVVFGRLAKGELDRRAQSIGFVNRIGQKSRIVEQQLELVLNAG
jgi:hypothetical protein